MKVNNKKESEELLSENTVDETNDETGDETSEKNEKNEKKQHKNMKGKGKTVSTTNKKTKDSSMKGSKTPKKTENGERYFKLIDAKTGKSYGRYTGDTPKQAASKGYTKMIQKMKKQGKTPPKHSTIFLRESTRGSARKVYGYEATRQRLDTPQTLVIIDGDTGEKKNIVYNYRNKIRKIPVPEQIGGFKMARGNKKKNKKLSSTDKSKKKNSTEKTKKNKPLEKVKNKTQKNISASVSK